VFPRTAKSIPVSAQARAVLGIGEAELTPAALMKAILKAPADLLYNGGIGTYVKASHQTNQEAGDRANDAIRVNGKDLRCKVVGEGGNLGFTQLGRVEYALAGGRICTDAIDNSAGVDCSDHEVNIKILLGRIVEDGEMTLKQRNALLAEMTDEVAALVLADNYYQTQSLAVQGLRADKLLDSQAAMMRSLERAGKLNRAVEFLPSEDEIAERRMAKIGLTIPERAVLLAYSKIVLSDELSAGTLVDDAYVARALVDYFPAQLRERYAEFMPKHALRRDIIATVLANTMINRTGSVYVHRMQEETGAAPEEVTRAFILVRDVFGLEPLWAEIDALDNRVPAQLQYEMLENVGRLVVRATLVVPAPPPREAADRRRAADLPSVARGAEEEHAGAAGAGGPRGMGRDGGPPFEAGRAAGACRARGEPRGDLRRARRDRGLQRAEEAGGRHLDAVLRVGRRAGASLDLGAHHGAADGYVVAGPGAQRASRRPGEPASCDHGLRGEALPGRARSGPHALRVEGALWSGHRAIEGDDRRLAAGEHAAGPGGALRAAAGAAYARLEVDRRRVSPVREVVDAVIQRP
jgi:hypothetical protein